MKKNGKKSLHGLPKRFGSAALAVAVVSSGLWSDALTVSAQAGTITNSWKKDINSAINVLSDAMSAEDAYANSVAGMQTALDELEGSQTVEGLAVTEVGADYIVLEWIPFESDDLIGYNVYWSDSNTDTSKFLLIGQDGKTSYDDTQMTLPMESIVEGDGTIIYRLSKSTHTNYYFKVAPVTSVGVGSKSEAVMSPTAVSYEAYIQGTGRGLTATMTDDGVYLNWRLHADEVTGYSDTGLTGTNFHVYRNGELIATVTDSTNYLDTANKTELTGDTYMLVPVNEAGEEITDDACVAYDIFEKDAANKNVAFKDIPLQTPANTTFRETYGIDSMSLAGYTMTDAGYSGVDATISYSANDMSVADVDGDGEYEYIVEWDPSASKDVSQQGYTGKQYIDCYELDGTLLWRLDLGINIRAGAHYTEFGVFDYDKDGLAEMVLKTAPGTKMIKYAIGEDGKNITDGNGGLVVASESYVTIPEEDANAGVTNESDFVFTTEEYRQYLIGVFKDWGIWNMYSEKTRNEAVLGHWSGNLVELFGVSTKYSDKTFYTGEVKSSANVTFDRGSMTTEDIQKYVPEYVEGDTLVNVCLRDENGQIQYVSSSSGVNPVLKTVRVQDVVNYYGSYDLDSCNFDATGIGYTEEQATILADYFLKHYEYRMKKHSLEVYEGYILTGPEYVTLFDCSTGNELDTVDMYYGREDDGMLWGDYAMNYIEPGNRCDRYNTATAYLDGETPSAIVARGYYTRTTFAAYNVVGKKLAFVDGIDSGWTVMSNPFNDGPHGMDGCDEVNGMLSGEGDHYVAVADIDGDGRQDIINGGAIVSYKDNGFYLYSAGGDYMQGGTGTSWSKYGHGDAIHVTDVDPDNPGLEIVSCFEGGAYAPYNWAVRDAETNTVLFGAPGTTDFGRITVGDVLENVRGLEVDTGYDCKGNPVTLAGVSNNQNIKWSADMKTQFISGTSSVSIIGNVAGKSYTFLSTSQFCTNNSTKGNPSLVADVFGDYREELIVRSTDNTKLRIYMNTEVSEHKNYTLMDNLQYRVGIASQNSAYNQPAYTDYYYASDTDWSKVTVPNAPSDQEPGKVIVNPANVTLNATSKTLLAGETYQLSAKVTPSTAEQTVVYSSEDESVATVSEDGLVTAIAKGTTNVTVETVNGKTAFCKISVLGAYDVAGLDQFAVGESKEFTFGTNGNVSASTIYDASTGYGFEKPVAISLTDADEYVAGTNNRSGSSTVTYEYPTFTLDVPTGIYEVKIVQGTNGTEDAVNGAYVEGNMYSVRWSTENFSASFTEPSAASYIYTKAGEEKISTVKTAVADGKLTVQFATSLTDGNESGTTYIKSVTVTRLQQNTEFSANPTLRFIGDSTLAKYPPEDGGTWAEIPERTGWGEEFSMGKFVDDSVVLVNKAVAGSSLASYVYDGYYNDFFLNCNPGDTVIIESGINDSAAGRRYSDATQFETRLRYLIESCQAFGLDVIISSGTSSSTTYTAKMESLAKEYELPYVDLLSQWNAYLTKTGATNGDVTVDGTHLDRVGGVVAAQIVANSIYDIDGLYISGHVKHIPLNYEAPTKVVTGLYCKAQTDGSTTLAWSIDEDSLYQMDQLITGFNVYGKVKGSKDDYTLIKNQTAYVSAGMSGPQLTTTFETPGAGSYVYYVTCKGLTGEGTASQTVNVAEFAPTTEYSLINSVEKYSEQLYDASTYTVASYAVLKLAIANAKEVLADVNATEEDKQAALAAVDSAVASLVLNVTEIERTDFQSEKLVKAPWGMTGTQSSLASAIMDENGNREIEVYVEAAGQRYVNKVFTDAANVSADKAMLEFEWYPGCPDTRNCTELEFFSSDANRVLSLKTSNNGHIGYVVGNYPSDNSYLIGDGFHTYEGSKAVDLGLTNEAWYNVQIVFNFADNTADLSIIPRDNASLDSAVVKGIAISADANTITKLNFLLKRGRTDGDAGNDLSILWDTFLDDFAYVYAEDASKADPSEYETVLTSYKEAVKGLNQSALSKEEIVLANAVVEIMTEDAGFFTETDYAYAVATLTAAMEAAPAKQNTENVSVKAETTSVTAGLSVALEASLSEGANEELVWSSSDESIAVVSGADTKAVVSTKKAGTVTITAKAVESGVSDSVTITVTGKAYFVNEATKAYDSESGLGLVNYTYPVEAAGWNNGIYSARALVESAGTAYVDSSSTEEYLAVNSQVWGELPEGSTREEDTVTYENTNAFAVDMEDGDYTVSVTFVNPTKTSMDVVVRANDIRRYDYGDHATSQIGEASIGAGQTKNVSFDIAVTDGKLTLRFEQAEVATSFAAAPTRTVYVKSVSVDSYKAAEKSKTGIYVCGDSTVQTYTNSDTYRTGWGQLLYTLFGTASEVNETSTGYAYYETEDTIVVNYARDGRSSKSFLEEGRLNEVLLSVDQGDYVFLQFAHNDDNQDRVNRFLSITDYKKMLSHYADAIAERGGKLVLVTPIVLNVWEADGTLDHRFDDYRLAMMEVAESKDLPVLDLMGSSYALVSAMGASTVNNLTMYMSDTVHTKTAGATLYTQLLGNLLVANKDASLEALKSNLDFTAEGNFTIATDDVIFVGDTANVVSNTTETLTLVSSDESVAKVVDGQIVGVSNGKAIITASYVTGDVTGTDCTAYSAYAVITVTDDASYFTEGSDDSIEIVVETVSVNAKVYASENVETVTVETVENEEETKSNVTVYTDATVAGKMPSPIPEYQFDFGTKSGYAGAPFVTITNQTYSEELGYGFVGDISGINFASHNDTSITSNDDSEYGMALRAACLDACRLAELNFAIDLPAGEYEIDIYSYDSWNTGWSDDTNFYVNDVYITTKKQGKVAQSVDEAKMSTRVVLAEDGQVVVKAEHSGRLAFISAITVNEYVERVDAYGADQWDALKAATASLQLKVNTFADDATPFDYDGVLVNKMLEVQKAIGDVIYMPLADTTLGEAVYAEAETAVTNKILYTENSISKLETAMNTYVSAKAELDVKEELQNLDAVITYWLQGVDTENVAEAYSLYVDFDSVQTGGSAYNNDLNYLTPGWVSIGGNESYPYFTEYNSERGYGAVTTFAGRNRSTGNTLLDDFMLGGTFAFDVPAGAFDVTVYTGDLGSGCKGASYYQFFTDYALDADGNVTGNLIAGDTNKVTSGTSSYITTTYHFEVAEPTTVTMVASGHTQAAIIEQIVDVTVEEFDVKELQTLVDSIDAKALVETDYTISTWNAFYAAYTEAKAAIKAGASYYQQQASVYANLETALQALTVRTATSEYAIDFGPHNEGENDPALWTSAALLSSFYTMENTEVALGFGDILYEENADDNGMHYGFTEKVASGYTATGGNYFRDWVYGEGGNAYTFKADLPAGDYYVYVYTGCKEAANTSKFFFNDGTAALETTNTAVETNAEGKTVYTQTSSAGGQFVAPGCIYKVSVPASSEALGYVKDKEIGTFSLTVFNDDPALAEDEVTARLCGIEICPAPVTEEEEEVVEPVEVPDTVTNVYSFDFGTRNSAEGFTVMGTEAYSEETGYGFVTDAAAITPARVGFDLSAYNYDPETESAIYTAASDMAFASDALEFRTDLEAGIYYFTIYASAGYFNETYSTNTVSVKVNEEDYKLVGTPAFTGTNLSDLALTYMLVLDEDASVTFKAENAGKRAFFNAIVIDKDVVENAYNFDFGTRNSGIAAFTTLGTESYDAATGYGFLTDAAAITPARVGFDMSAYSYLESQEALHTAASDMTFASDELQFRLDLTAGDYYFETYASAGYFNATYAKNDIFVSVNGGEFVEIGVPAYEGTKITDLRLMNRVSLEEDGYVVFKVVNEGGRAFLNAMIVNRVVSEDTEEPEVPEEITEIVTDLATWVSGDYSCNTGRAVENATRIRTVDAFALEAGKYTVSIANGSLKLVLREYNADGKFVGSINCANNMVLTVQEGYSYKGMLYGLTGADFQAYVEAFQNGFGIGFTRNEDATSIEGAMGTWISGNYSSNNGKLNANVARISLESELVLTEGHEYAFSVPNEDCRVLVRMMNEEGKYVGSVTLANDGILKAEEGMHYFVTLYKLKGSMIFADYLKLFAEGFDVVMTDVTVEEVVEEITEETTEETVEETVESEVMEEETVVDTEEMISEEETVETESEEVISEESVEEFVVEDTVESVENEVPETEESVEGNE